VSPENYILETNFSLLGQNRFQRVVLLPDKDPFQNFSIGRYLRLKIFQNDNDADPKIIFQNSPVGHAVDLLGLGREKSHAMRPEGGHFLCVALKTVVKNFGIIF